MFAYTFKYHLRMGLLLDALLLFMAILYACLFNLNFNIGLLVALFFQRTFLQPLKLTPASALLIKITNANCVPLLRAAHIVYMLGLIVAYVSAKIFGMSVMVLWGRAEVLWGREVAWLLQSVELYVVMLMVGAACCLSDLTSIQNIIKRKIACYFLQSIAIIIVSMIIGIVSFIDKYNIGLTIIVAVTIAIWYSYTQRLTRLINYIHFEQ